jgi:hypothetical protein
MPTNDLYDDESHDDHDKSRVNDMEEYRPIYSATNNMVVQIIQRPNEDDEHSEKDI